MTGEGICSTSVSSNARNNVEDMENQTNEKRYWAGGTIGRSRRFSTNMEKEQYRYNLTTLWKLTKRSYFHAENVDDFVTKHSRSLQLSF